MDYKVYLILMFGFSLGTKIKAPIYESRILHKIDPTVQGPDQLIILSDFHDKTSPVNAQQIQQLDTFFQASDPKTTGIDTEDLSSCNNSGKSACGRFFVNSRGGILGGLAEKCINMGFSSVNNDEYRYCRVASLGPVLNDIQKPLAHFPSVNEITMHVLLHEIMDVIQQVQSYNDSNALKKEYDAIIKKVLADIKALHIDQHPEMTVAQYLDSHSTLHNRLELLKKLLTFDSGLVDARMMHSLHIGQGKKRMITIAGGAHAGRVGDVFEKNGYKCTESTKVTFAREHSLDRCLGSHIIDGAFCIKPQPISLDFLTRLTER